MQAYVEGDVGAFEQLFDVLAPALRRFFGRSVRDVQMAEDLVQSTFLKLHSARRRWRRGERLRPWVFAIAANVRADWHRRRLRRAPEEAREDADPIESPGEDPTAELDARERDERVHRAVEGLDESQRIVVHLHRFEGLSFAEIGGILGISEGAAKLRAFRVLDDGHGSSIVCAQVERHSFITSWQTIEPTGKCGYRLQEVNQFVDDGYSGHREHRKAIFFGAAPGSR